VIPAHEPSTGNLPPGEHLAEWVDVVERFGTTPWRRQLLEGLARALRDLRAAGCKRAYIDGSFITTKEHPDDFDACWDLDGVDFDLIDEVLLTFDAGRRAQKALREAAQSQIDDLLAEVAEYERLRDGQLTAITAESIADLAPALIKARIMRNWTQKELADKLAVAEQQVQRYEATQYKGVSVERLQAVADALKLRVREVITFEPL